ncbi:MAG: hypothetical protein JWN34_1031 [Bryobacterales bacterium]|nr:hypothetical protein [Bryobacterales bacterium]
MSIPSGRRLWLLTSTLLVLLTGCGSGGPPPAPVIGEAWAGPATLNLRKEVDLKSPTMAVAKHGDKLQIIAKRRSWYKVRNARGIEGWVDDRQLMDSGQMTRLQKMEQENADLPSQGAATSFDTLNVHSEPNRLSASFLQVKEGEKFDVIAHRVQERKPLPRRQLLPPVQKGVGGKKPKKEPKLPPPPPPVPPSPPADWVELSKQSAQVPEEDLPPVAHDDWMLIRTKNGQSGWVLTSRVYLAIPDEVAQYAEGHRIMSYFSIGKVVSVDDGEKEIWLWTTAASLGRDYDFDGYRVFTWNTRRHRYETAFIQRRVRGFFPVLAKTGQFSVCTENADGSTSRKRFTLVGNAVRGAGEEPCSPPAAISDQPTQARIEVRPAAAAATEPGGTVNQTLVDRVRDRWRKLTAR